MRRLLAVAIKEFWAILRDPKSRIVLVVPPIIQLFIFNYATTLDVKNATIGALNLSTGVEASEFIARVEGSPTFDRVRMFRSQAELSEAIDRQRVIAALVFDADFDRRLAAHQPVEVGLVLDGRRSNAAQIVGGYLTRIAGAQSLDVARRTIHGVPSDEDALGVRITNWFNPTLDYMWFTLPSLIAIIVSVSGLALTSQAVARERELGTFDQLMVSPLAVWQILIGKMAPPFALGLINGTFYFIVAQAIWGVPFTGSVLLFYLALSIYQLALIGVGMLVSAASQTQQQAFLGSFVATTPLIMLSGYASPIENMPGWLQIVTYADPARYFIVIVQGVFLKAMPAAQVFHQLWPLALIAATTLGAAAWLFRARME